MKVAIAGGGNVGAYIAADLKEAGHEVLVIEQDADLVGRLSAWLDVEWYVGDACEVYNLHDAGLADADVVVAATGDDEDNLVVSLLAKQEFAVPRGGTGEPPEERLALRRELGCRRLRLHPHLLTALVEEAVSVGTIVRLLRFEHGNAGLVEVTLAEDSPAAGKTVSDLAIPRDATVVAVVRADHVIVPRGDTVVQAGDEVLCLVTGTGEDAIKAIFVA